MNKLSIVIPVYNEKKTIKEIIKQVKKACKNKEIIIVDDFENEKSWEEYFLNVDGKRYELEVKNSNGSIQNIQDLIDDKIDFALCQEEIAYDAISKLGYFEDKNVENISFVCGVYFELMHLMVKNKKSEETIKIPIYNRKKPRIPFNTSSGTILSPTLMLIMALG